MRRAMITLLCAMLALSAVTSSVAAAKPVKLNWIRGVKFAPVTLSRGQTVTLAWNAGFHSVYKVPSGVCPASYSSYRPLVTPKPVGSFTYKCVTPSTAVILGEGDLRPECNLKYWIQSYLQVYYACSIPTHCSSGQIVKVTCA